MRFCRRVGCVLVLVACARATEVFTTNATPAFLGAASGIYQVVSNTGVSIPNGTRFLTLEIRGQLVMVGQDLGDTTFAFVGPLTRDGNGGGSAAGTITLIGSDNQGGTQGSGTSFALPVPANLSLGIDALGLVGHDSPPNKPVPCFSSSAGCGFALTKLCDFDPQIAGIFSMQVVATGDNGQCAGHDSLAGARQWAVATINASTSSIILSVTNEKLEFGSVLSLDLQSRAFTNVLSVPLTSDVSSNPVVEFTGDVALTSQNVKVDATSLTRTFPDGCVQSYTATGTRQQGVTFATACPPNNGLECFNDFSGCPPVPASFKSASYVVSATSDSGTGQ